MDRKITRLVPRKDRPRKAGDYLLLALIPLLGMAGCNLSEQFSQPANASHSATNAG